MMIQNQTKYNIFLTGITGFIGSHLALKLVQLGHNITAIVRNSNLKEVARELSGTFRFIDSSLADDDIARIFSNIEFISGDIVQDNLGFQNKERIARLSKSIEIIIHSAGMASFMENENHLYNVNYNGTRNVLDFASQCNLNGNLKIVLYLSTIFIVGNSKKTFSESDLNVGQQFNNFYEQSKFEAEVLVHQYRKQGLNIAVIRPSLVAGDSTTGRTSSFKSFYHLLQCLANRLFDVLPADPSSMLNIININKLVDILANILHIENEKTYHLINNNNISIFDFVQQASSYFDFQMPVLIPKDQCSKKKFTKIQKTMLEPFEPYLNNKNALLFDKTYKHLNKNNIIRPTLEKKEIDVLFKYCLESGYIRKS